MESGVFVERDRDREISCSVTKGPFLFVQFVKFANIEEDTPSYHRSYDFFVSRFSEMCHSEHEDLDVQNRSVCLLLTHDTL